MKYVAHFQGIICQSVHSPRCRVQTSSPLQSLCYCWERKLYKLTYQMLSPGSCVPKIYPRFKPRLDLQNITRWKFVHIWSPFDSSVVDSIRYILHLLVERCPKYGSVVNIWVENEVRSGEAQRKIIFHKLSFACVICSLEKGDFIFSLVNFLVSPAIQPTSQHGLQQLRCSQGGHPSSDPEMGAFNF